MMQEIVVDCHRSCFRDVAGARRRCLDLSLTPWRCDEHKGVGMLSGKVSFLPCGPQLGSQEQPGALEQDGPDRSVQGSTVDVCLTFLSWEVLPGVSWHRSSSTGSLIRSD